MPIEFECSSCQQRLQVPNEVAASSAKCPHCGTVQTVPPSMESAPPPVTPDPSAPPHNPYAENPYRDAPEEPPNPYASPHTSGSPELYFYGRKYNLASRGDRFLGALLDWVCFIAAVAPGFAVSAIANAANAQVLEPLGGLVVFGGFVAYHGIQWYLITTTAQSLGKRMMNMRIITTSGMPPGFVHGVILRNWTLGFTCICYPVGGILWLVDGLVIFTENRQCLHDLIASTLVVSEKTTS